MRLCRSIFRICGFLLAGAIVNSAIIVPIIRGIGWFDTFAQLADGTIECNSGMLRTGNGGICRTDRSPGVFRLMITSGPFCGNAVEMMDVLTDADVVARVPPDSCGRNFRSDINEFTFRQHPVQREQRSNLVELASGWPLYALRYQFTWSLAAQVSTDSEQLFRMPVHIEEQTGRLRLPDSLASKLRVTALPYRPLWPGFAINTLFYAAILWVLFAAPGRFRRWLRSRRGLCVACAYPIGTSPVCTECGTALVRT